MKKILFLLAALWVLQLKIILPDTIATSASDTLQSLTAKLESWDVEMIWPEVKKALAKHPQSADLLEIAAQIAFYRGDYPEALQLMKQSLEVGGEHEKRQAFIQFFEETINVLASYRRYETPHFIISLDAKQDGLLVDYLTDALEKTYEVMSQAYDFSPEHKVRIELLPDTVAFYLASTLSVRDIEVTGAVGLAKFNKLQFLSPRALVHGYRWLDAISHEYMHYLIVKLTSNKAPIWFHEGFAKYEETRWRDGPDYLAPLYRSLLAQAQVEQHLIPFAKMEPSLVQFETPEEVQLAYAQSASAIEFIISLAGHEGLKKIMDQMARSRKMGAGQPVKEVLGLEFSEFEKQWTAYLAAKKLKPAVGLTVHRYKVKEKKADEQRLDLEEIKSMVARNRAYLGDRLKARGRTGAAMLEYRRALAETRDSVPVMNRLSIVLIDLDQNKEALELLKRILHLAPDHPTPYKQLGQVYLKLKDYQQAKAAFKESIQINPFNPVVHVGLANAYAMLGDKMGFARERDIAYRLRR